MGLALPAGPAEDRLCYGRQAVELLSSSRDDFSEYAAAPSLRSFSSFICDRLVSTMTGMSTVAGFAFRALRTSGPLILEASSRGG